MEVRELYLDLDRTEVEFNTCEMCGTMVEDTDTVEIDGGHYCQDCKDDIIAMDYRLYLLAKRGF